MPVVLIEGVDGTGKSTLADAIVDRVKNMYPFETRLEHYGVPIYDHDSELSIGQQAINQLLERLQDFDNNRDFLVLDRFHWGEPVYAPIFRSHACVEPLFGTLTHKEFMHAENWLRTVGGYNAYCLAPTETIVQRLETRGEELLDNEHTKRLGQIKMLQERYETLIKYLTADARPQPADVGRFVLESPDDTRDAANIIVDRALDKYSEAMDNYETAGMSSAEIKEICKPVLFTPEDQDYIVE